jgi:hypothetical protein
MPRGHAADNPDMKRLLPVALAVAASGCLGDTWRHPVPSPYAPFDRVAVAPVVNAAGGKMDPVSQTAALGSEFVRHAGFEVVRPSDIALTAGTDEQWIEAARAAGAHSVLLADVTEYRTYYPPRVALRVRFLMTDRSRAALDQNFEAVYDGADDITRFAAASWATARVEEDSAFEDGDGVLRERDRYWRFVSSLVVDRILDNELARQERLKPKWHDAEHP